MISDFVDQHYQRLVGIVSKKHDLVPIIVQDPRESELPDVGYICFEDSESGEPLYINSQSEELRHKYRYIMETRRLEQDRFFSSINVDTVRIDTQSSYINALRKYFEFRARRC